VLDHLNDTDKMFIEEELDNIDPTNQLGERHKYFSVFFANRMPVLYISLYSYVLNLEEMEEFSKVLNKLMQECPILTYRNLLSKFERDTWEEARRADKEFESLDQFFKQVAKGETHQH
jgi:hypothetical protein